MSPEFIRDTLFVPFRSTKRSGFGVGAFQCREFAREQGGDLDVISSPGSGTTMRLSFPALL
jgi:signal transduction histidine kinase